MSTQLEKCNTCGEFNNLKCAAKPCRGFKGIPKNENEWLKYETMTITLFAATHRYCENTGIHSLEETDEKTDDTTEYWILEDDEITTNKLIDGLKTVGVICESVDIIKTNIYEGKKQVKCICCYNKPYQVYNSDFFIKGLSTYNPDELVYDYWCQSQLEVCFGRRIYQ